MSFAKDLAKEAKRDKLKATTNELKIDEAEVEDCPSFKAPQDLKAGPDAVPTSEPADRESRPMFIINDGFKRKSSTHRSASSAAAAAAAAADEQLLAAATAGWLTVKSTEPTRNQSALSIFDMTPRRNFSTASFHGEKEVLRSVRNRLEQYMSDEEADQGTAASSSCSHCTCNRRASDPAAVHEDEDRFTWWQRLFIFFDLDLLRDPSYVNLMVGVTIASFAELNYSILTPFVLADFGLSKTQTATTMSLLGLMDISVRFFVPFLAGRIGWENKTFFLVGVLGMALGRICELVLFDRSVLKLCLNIRSPPPQQPSPTSTAIRPCWPPPSGSASTKACAPSSWRWSYPATCRWNGCPAPPGCSCCSPAYSTSSWAR